MDDTTSLHLAADILAHVAPSLDVMSTEAADLLDAHSAAAAARRRHTVGDEDFPFPSCTIHGVKCCSKCGATKTPQWREGPLGPKTLCNACGVKRTRKLRAEQEGGKRRKLSASPAVRPRAAAATATYRDPSPARLDSLDFDVFQPSGAAAEPSPFFTQQPYHAHYHNYTSAAAALPPPTGGRRSARRAAEDASLHTARAARTGEWAEEAARQGHLHWTAVVAVATAAAAAHTGLGASEPEPAALLAAAPASTTAAGDGTPTASGSGDSLPSSNCPEEVSWSPAAAAARAGSVAAVALPPPAPRPDLLDTHAAAELLARGLPRPGASPQREHQRSPLRGQGSPAGSSLGGGSQGAGACSPSVATAIAIAPASEEEQANHDAMLELLAQQCGSSGGGAGATSALAPHAVVPIDLASLSKLLPPNKVSELVRLNRELEGAVHEAAASNAAVAAVAQVLAAKQQAALQARDAALGATKRLRRFMSELDTQFGIQSQALQPSPSSAMLLLLSQGQP